MSEPFVRSGNRQRTLAEVKERAARFGGALRSLGLQHGERYAIVMRNEIGFLEANLAAAPIGAVPVPVNWHWNGLDLRHLLTDSESRIVVAHSDPGVPDWIETVGHHFGTMCCRWVRPEGEGEPPTPQTRVVRLADVAKLP